MAKTSMIVKCNRKQKFSTHEYTRCQRCGRPALCVPQVRPVPCLLPRARTQGRTSGIKKGQLVSHCQRVRTRESAPPRTEVVPS